MACEFDRRWYAVGSIPLQGPPTYAPFSITRVALSPIDHARNYGEASVMASPELKIEKLTVRVVRRRKVRR